MCLHFVESKFIHYYPDFKQVLSKRGRAAKSTRLVIGTLVLRQISGLSDEKIICQWEKNSSWQFFMVM